MRNPILVVGLLASTIAVPAAAQESAVSRVDAAAVCAPPAVNTRAAHELRVIGAQDTTPRTVLGPRDLIMISGGSQAGVQLGAEFFVRRTPPPGGLWGNADEGGVETDGVIQVVAVNDTTSMARVERSCGAMFAGDFLEPFVAPSLPAVSDEPIEPDFSSLAHVLGASGGKTMAGLNEVALIDSGTENGVQPGARFAIYRDLTSADPLLAAPAGTPLTPIGEVIVISAGADRSVVRVTRARDAIFSGDYAAPQKP